MEPPVLSRGERVIYAVLIALMLTGLILNTLGAWLGIHLQLLAIPCLIAPAMFAATSAVRHLKDDAVVRRFVKDNPTLPKNVHFDVESRVAIITTPGRPDVDARDPGGGRRGRPARRLRLLVRGARGLTVLRHRFSIAST
jgi:hypothetical protein